MMYIIAIALALIILITIVINSMSVRANEAEDSLRVALDQAITSLDYSKIHFTTAEELENELIKSLITSVSVQTNSESDLSIEVLNCDIEKGIIDIRVTETYKVFSKEKAVSVKRTVLIDEVIEEEKENNQIYFGVVKNNKLYTIDKFSLEFPDGNIYQDGVVPSGIIIDFDNICLGFTNSSNSLNYFKNGQQIGAPDDDDIIIYIGNDIINEIGIDDSNLLTMSAGWCEYQGASSEKITGQYAIFEDVIFIAI